MRVVEVATVISTSGRGDELAAILPQVVELLDGLGTTGRCAALRQVEDPDRFLFAIEWDSLEAHSRFRASADFVRYQRLVDGLIEPDGRLTHYHVLVASTSQTD